MKQVTFLNLSKESSKSSESMTKVSLVILNWERINDTLECLESVGKLNTDGFILNTIVVDNASTDDSLERLKKTKGIDLILSKSNLGFTGGNNLGIKKALENGAGYIIILNNDTILDKDSITQLVKEMLNDSTIGVMSPKIYFAKGFEYKKQKYKESDLGKVIWYAGGIIDWKNVYGVTRGVDEIDNGQFEKIEETDFATGTCLILSRKAIEMVGMFDENYNLYYEDTDLSQRIRKAGFKVMFNPKAIIWHKVAQSSGIGSKLNDYYISRNRLMFGMKYASLRTKLALLRESIKLLFTGRTWQKIGVRDYFLRRLGKGSWK